MQAPCVMKKRPNTGIQQQQRESLPVELQQLETQVREDESPDTDPLNPESYRVSEERRAAVLETLASTGQGARRPELWQCIKTFWEHNIALIVPQKSNRDYFGEFFD